MARPTVTRNWRLAALTPEMALRVEKAFGPDMDQLFRTQLAYDVAKTRVPA